MLGHWLRRLLDRTVVFTLLLAAAGCEHFIARPLQPEQGVVRLEQRTLADPSLRRFIETNQSHTFDTWPPPEWDLDTLTLTAFYFHPDLDVARAVWKTAQAGQISAAEWPNPSVGITPAYNTTTSIPSPWIVTPALDIPVETAGKRGYRMAQASHLSEAARLQIAETAWQIRSNVRRSLLDLYAADTQLTLLKKQKTVLADYVQLLESQYQAGEISAYDLNQARISAENEQLSLEDAEQQNQQALVKLAESLGVTVNGLEGMHFSFTDINRLAEDLPDADARRRALSSRADILRALSEYAASQSALQLEIARQYPDINLGPGYEYDQGDNKWSLGISVTMPVFNQNQGAIAEARARRDEAAARFNALQARVLAEIDLAVAGYRTALQQHSDAEEMLQDMQKQQHSAEAMFKTGEISRSELDERELQLVNAELTRLDTLIKTQESAGQLEDALQSPLGLPDAVWQAAPRSSESDTKGEHS